MVGFNGIDFISVNNADRRILIGEIRHQTQRIDMNLLKEKAKGIAVK